MGSGGTVLTHIHIPSIYRCPRGTREKGGGCDGLETRMGGIKVLHRSVGYNGDGSVSSNMSAPSR